MTPLPLEPDRPAFEDLAGAAVAFLADFVDARAGAPASDVEGFASLVQAAAAPPPDRGRPLPELLELVGAGAVKGFDTAGPGYVGFIPGGGLMSAAVADLLALGTNQFMNIAAATPVFAAIEASVIRWLCGLFGLPDTSLGILTSGGSMANFSAVVAARNDRLPETFLTGTIYVSEHVHQSVAKAARLAGFPLDAVRTVACTPDLAIDVVALAGEIAADRAAGRTPFLLVGSAGTTNTGAVDPLDALADLAAAEGLWFHVDAAYGGFFQLTSRGRRALAGIERADSITLDPHKGMFLPYGTGCLLVRDGERLRAAHQAEGQYLQDLARGDLPDFADYSPELSREFRGLRVWLPLHLHGVDAFRAALDEKLDLARHVYDALARDGRLEVPWEPPLSIVAFRLRDGDATANRALLERINASKRVFLSSTVVDGDFTLRVCVLSHRTHRDRIDELVKIIGEAVET